MIKTALMTTMTLTACLSGSSAVPEQPSPTHTRTPVPNSSPAAAVTQTPRPTSRAAPTVTPEPTALPPPPPVTRGDATRQAVYLTFDDGYGYTDEVLSILQERGTPATACLLGRVIETRPDFVRRWTAAGYTVCNHTFWHGDLTRLDYDDLRSEIELTEAMLEEVAPGATMLPFMRPPLGQHNEIVRAVAASLGYRVVLWSLNPEDWWPGIDVETIRRRVVEGASNGDIILLHFQHLSTVQALPSIIDGLRAQGFEILGLESLPSGG